VACGQTTRHTRKNREEHVGGAHPKKRKKAALHLVPKLSTGTKVPN